MGVAQANRQQMVSSIVGLNHSMMAMQAAKRMRSSKQKRRTGHVVCHHLRMMLKAEEPVRAGAESSVPDFFDFPLPKSSRNKQQFTLGL